MIISVLPDLLAAHEKRKKALAGRPDLLEHGIDENTFSPPVELRHGFYPYDFFFEQDLKDEGRLGNWPHYKRDNPDILRKLMEVPGSLGDYLQSDEYRSSYGVADNFEQIEAYYKKDIEDPDHDFVFSIHHILKSDQPPQGGWRWHKWGPYIGKHTPEYEYLADEEGIEEVLCFHIYEVIRKV